ncbi:MAG: hypothetical protein WBP13_08015 [Methylophilaceae bacterium]
MLNAASIAKSRVVLPFFILALAIFPSFPVVRVLIENSMTFHMLFQIPMLILAGYLLKNKPKDVQYSLMQSFAQWLWIYLAGLFWMLPISLDKALIYPAWDIFKIISLLITGAILKVVFQSHRILALFFIGSTTMMLFFVGFYYQGTDVRLCNAYLIESQQVTGIGLVVVASLLLLFLLWKIQQGLKAMESNK